MSRPTSRLHRLPQRLDYTLIPAPLDLSLEHMSEKSALPTIIVTPSSPTGSGFSIAFLAPPPKPTLFQRGRSYISNLTPLRTSTLFMFMFLFFVLSCHYLAHRLAVSRDHLDFLPAESSGMTTGAVGFGGGAQDADGLFGGWFDDLGALWGAAKSRTDPPGDFARILESRS